MSSFNNFGKLEDASYKLKLMNKHVHEYKKQTNKLEDDTDILKNQLQNVKAALDQENKLDVHWKNGNAGHVRNYAKDIVNTNKYADLEKKRKLRELRSEKNALTKESKANYEAFLNKTNNIESKRKIKTQKCGQCDSRNSQVSCIECGEDYCAACFAAFHLKGALKRHRTKPVGMDRLTTPRPDVEERRAMTSRTEQAQSVLEKPGKDKPTALLLGGSYNEEESSESFQEALKQWRQTADSKPETIVGKEIRPSQHAPVKTGSTQATATETAPQQPAHFDIKFSSSNHMTYAEQLLINKFRRNGFQPRSITNNRNAVDTTSCCQGDDDRMTDRSGYLGDDDRMTDRFGCHGDEMADDGGMDDRPYSVLSDILPVEREKSANNRHINELIMKESNVKIVEIEDDIAVKKSKKTFTNTLNNSNNSNNSNTLNNSNTWNNSSNHSNQFTPKISSSPIIPKETPRTRQSIRKQKENTNGNLSASLPRNLNLDTNRKSLNHFENNNNNNHNNILKEFHKTESNDGTSARSESGRNSSRSNVSSARPKSSNTKHQSDVLTLQAAGSLVELAHKSSNDVPQVPCLFQIGSGDQNSSSQVDGTPRPVSSRRGSAFNEDKLSNKFYKMGPKSWRPEESLVIDGEKHGLNEESDSESVLKERKQEIDEDEVALNLDAFRDANNRSAHSRKSGRISQMIVVDGDDLSSYDQLGSSRDVDDEALVKIVDEQLAKEAQLVHEALFVQASANAIQSNQLEVGKDEEAEEDEETLDDNLKNAPALLSVSSFKLRESQLMSDFKTMEALIEEEEDTARTDADDVIALK